RADAAQLRRGVRLRALRQRAPQLDRHLADRDGPVGHARDARGLRDRAAAFPRQAARAVDGARDRDGPHDLARPAAVRAVPLAAPGVFTAAILTFFFAWNDFVFGISLTASDAARPVPAALAFFTGESFFEQPAAQIAAASLVVTVPVIVLVLLFQRRIVAGLTAGAGEG